MKSSTPTTECVSINTVMPTMVGSSSSGGGSQLGSSGEPDATPLNPEGVTEGCATPAMPSSHSQTRRSSILASGLSKLARRGSRSLSQESQRSLSRSASAHDDNLFNVSPEVVPAIGGCVELYAQHSEYLLPPEVALFEPSDNEIFCNGDRSGGHRQIFLNTLLEPEEQTALSQLHTRLQKKGYPGGKFPPFMRLHALRMLQLCKYDADKTVALMQTFLSERVARLPICEADVLEDLHSGFMYWHGRDRKCRPCLVIRLERMGDMVRDKERAVRLVIFVLEYAARYAMVPGRVENWVVLLDFANVMSIISPMHLAGMMSTAVAIATALEKVYCGRMVWIKLVNMPGNGMLRNVVNGAIPTDKKQKVMFPQDMESVAEDFEPGQLERRYGGAAPDLQPGATYPFHFFPRCTGPAEAEADDAPEAAEAEGRLEQQATGQSSQAECSEYSSLHHFSCRRLHEGQLWDDSLPEIKAQYLQEARMSSLTPAAAQAASRLMEEVGRAHVAPCRDVRRWLSLVDMLNELGQESERPSIRRFGGLRARAASHMAGRRRWW